MELYIHIGWPKTGTSAIQIFMRRNRETLKEKFSIFYPHGVIYPDGTEVHNKHAFCLMDDPYNTARLDRNVVLPDALSVYQSTVKEAEKIGASKVVISSEWLYVLKDNEIKKLSDILKTFPDISDINIIVYLRRQDLLLESGYRQGVEHHAWKFFGNIFTRAPQDYLSILERWRNNLPESNIIVRLYDRSKLKNGDVVDDFLSILGVERKDVSEEKVEANPSLSHLSALALRRINEEFDLPPGIHQKLVEFLFEIDKREGSFLKTFMTLEERIKLLEYYKESNKKLFREYLGTENQFVLSEEEIEFYKEQDEIPKEKIEEAVEDRYRRALRFLYSIKSNPPRRQKIYLDEKYGRINPLIKHGLINSGVFGYVDIVDNEKIAGWILDLDTKEPAEFVIKVNGIAVYEGRANIVRKNVVDITGYNIPTGFNVSWSEIELPSQMKKEVAKLEVEVVHKRTGYIVPGNYKKSVKVANTKVVFPKCKLKYYPNELDFFRIDVLNANLLNGRLVIGGLALPKVDAEELKLTIKDAEGVKEVRWGLPSPGFGEQRKDNPKAKNARFRVDGVVVGDKPIEVIVDGKKVVEIRIGRIST